MRGVRRRADTAAMTFTTPIRMTVEVACENRTIAGRVIDEAGGEQPFTGWVGLVQALDDQISGEASAEPAQPAGHRAARR